MPDFLCFLSYIFNEYGDNLNGDDEINDDGDVDSNGEQQVVSPEATVAESKWFEPVPEPILLQKHH